MTRAERLNPVVLHADKKEQQALKGVALSQNQVEAEKVKLRQLESYRNEYMNKQGLTGVSCSVVELQEFNRFLAQLDDTIKKQSDVIRFRESELESKRRSWLETRKKSNIMHQVIKNLLLEEKKQISRSEQKSMDEFSQRKRQEY
ncbi:MAG: flagellar export protein FliJ [Gammaproteobacteria bacterium]|nr:flagellar export protein FliJ [Gammaproteobacteria bacterium]